MKKCPKCKEEYTGYPAISRDDNKTKVCSDCGTKEALEVFALNMANKKQK
jgi:hypothetical protein